MLILLIVPLYININNKIIDFNNFVEMYESIKIKKNNLEITNNDNYILNKELNSNGKDIIIILDWFISDKHGQDVSDKFQNYFKYYLKREKDIHTIYLSFNKSNNKQYKEYIENIDLVNHKINRFYRYQIISQNVYSLETYLKRIRELNPNSKIVLSLSVHVPYFRNIVIELSKKYDFKIGQAYFNNGFFDKEYDLFTNKLIKEYWKVMFWFNFVMDKTNTIVIPTKEYKPFFWIKQYSYNDLKVDDEEDFEYNFDSSSFLTPIITYEYYLNPNSNIIKK